jgi:hypothetical protein
MAAHRSKSGRSCPRWVSRAADHQRKSAVYVRSAPKADKMVRASKGPLSATSEHRRHSRNERYGTSVLGGASLWFDVGSPEHLGPFLNVVRDEFPQFGGRACKGRIAAQIGETRLHFGVGQTRVDRLI